MAMPAYRWANPSGDYDLWTYRVVTAFAVALLVAKGDGTSLVFGEPLLSMQLQLRPDDVIDMTHQDQRQALEPAVNGDQMHAIE